MTGKPKSACSASLIGLVLVGRLLGRLLGRSESVSKLWVHARSPHKLHNAVNLVIETLTASHKV